MQFYLLPNPLDVLAAFGFFFLDGDAALSLLFPVAAAAAPVFPDDFPPFVRNLSSFSCLESFHVASDKYATYSTNDAKD